MAESDGKALSNPQTASRRRWLILAVVSVGTFMATLDSSIVSVALPTMSAELQANLLTLQWVVTAYLLTISSLLPVFGRIADLFGRKRVFSLGIIVFTLGSLLCGLASNVWLLIAMRVVQAVGASMLMSNSAAIITATFPPQERGRALGLTGTVVALGSLTGPPLGGILVGLTSWHFIFFVNLPIGIIGYTAAQVILPKDSKQQKQERFDFAGAALFSTGMICLLLAVSNGKEWGWSSLPVITGLVLGAILLGLFFVAESKVKNPVIDLSLFKNPPFLFGTLAGLLSFVAMFANFMLMPFYLQHVQGFEPQKVGLLMTAFPLVMAVIAPLSGYLSDRIGPAALTTGGLVVSALGLLYLSFLPATSIGWWWVVPGPTLVGLGAGMFQSPNNSSVMGSVPKPKLGLAGGITALVRNVGMVLGIAFSVTLLESRQAAALRGIVSPTVAQQNSAFVSAYQTVLLAAVFIALVAAVISFNRKGYAKR